MFVALATAALSATAVYSQLDPVAIGMTGLQELSSECRTAVLGLATSPLVDCLGITTLLPAISANASIVPILDNWMTEICANDACDQELLDSTAQNFSSACASDLLAYDVSGSDVQDIFGMYPLVRELVCLKTSEPFMNSTMNATMSSNTTMDASNSTANSTEFCVTSLLTEVSDYLGMNLTVNGIFGLVVGSDTEGREALTEIPATALCQDCIYAGAGLIEQQYPGIWNHTIGSGNFTVGGFLNQTCVNETFPEIDREMNNTITLPDAIFPSAENSTYPYPIIYSNGTYTPNTNTTQQAPTLPFVNLPPMDVEGGMPAPSAVNPDLAPSASATESMSMPSMPAVSGASSVSAELMSVLSAASSAAPLPTKRDVTAAKRRWVGQQ